MSRGEEEMETYPENINGMVSCIIENGKVVASFTYNQGEVQEI